VNGNADATGARRLLVSCGEPSGDLYASEVVRHLRERDGALEVFGLGGERLLAQEARLIAHVSELAVVGLVEVLRHLRRLRRVFHQVLAEVDRRPVSGALLVDYAGFNLRLARELHRRGVRVAYYVSPQVWAWRSGRIRTVRECVSRMVVIFPFEEAFYRRHGVSATFVGHPLVELSRSDGDSRSFLRANGLDPGRPVLAVLPGSRRQEIAYNLPPLAEALRRLRAERAALQAAIAVAPGLDPAAIQARLADADVRLVPGQAGALMRAATAGVIASGTATVEAALMDLPSAVVYRLSPLSYALGRPFVRLPHYAMVNLIAGREVMPELIQGEFRPDSVVREVRRLLDDEEARSAQRRGLAEVRKALGGPGASQRAAAVVAELLK
jgi:lipid-A-disaccharide synthase